MTLKVNHATFNQHINKVMLSSLLKKIVGEFFFDEKYKKCIILASNHPKKKVNEISMKIDLLDNLISNIQKHIGLGNLKHAFNLILVLNYLINQIKQQLNDVELISQIS